MVDSERHLHTKTTEEIDAYVLHIHLYFQEELAKLLLFESSHKDSGKKVGLVDYVSRIKDNERSIYYLAAPKLVYLFV